jgi:hypothetical protein
VITIRELAGLEFNGFVLRKEREFRHNPIVRFDRFGILEGNVSAN